MREPEDAVNREPRPGPEDRKGGRPERGPLEKEGRERRHQDREEGIGKLQRREDR